MSRGALDVRISGKDSLDTTPSCTKLSLLPGVSHSSNRLELLNDTLTVPLIGRLIQSTGNVKSDHVWDFSTAFEVLLLSRSVAVDPKEHKSSDQRLRFSPYTIAVPHDDLVKYSATPQKGPRIDFMKRAAFAMLLAIIA